MRTWQTAAGRGGGRVAPGPAAAPSCVRCSGQSPGHRSSSSAPPRLLRNVPLPSASPVLEWLPPGDLPPKSSCFGDSPEGKQCSLGVSVHQHTCTHTSTHTHTHTGCTSPAPTQDAICNCQERAEHQGHRFLATRSCSLWAGPPWSAGSLCRSQLDKYLTPTSAAWAHVLSAVRGFFVGSPALPRGLVPLQLSSCQAPSHPDK